MNEEEKKLEPMDEQVQETAASVPEELNGAEYVSPEVSAQCEAAGEPAAPETKKKCGKKGLLISIAAVVVIAIAAIIVSVATASPLNLLGKGIVNSVNAMQKNDATVFMQDVVEGGSVEFLCDLETLLELPVEGALSLKMYSAVTKAALIADVQVAGNSVVDLGMFADGKSMAIASDVLFGSTAYGTKLENLADRFNNSEFGPNGEFSLGMEMPDQADATTVDAEKLAQDSKKIAQDMISSLMKSVKEHTEIDKANDTLAMNGSEVKVTALEIWADSTACSELIRDMVEYFRSNADLKEYLYNYADYFAVMLVSSGVVYEDYEDPKSVIDQLYAQLDDISDEDLAGIAQDMEEAELEIVMTFYITKSGKELVGVKVESEADGEEVKVSALAGPTWEKLEEISVWVDDGYSVTHMSYVVEKNDEDAYSTKLKVSEDSEDLLTGEITWDKAKGDFEAQIVDDWGDTYGVQGSIEADAQKVTVELDSVYGEGEEYDLGVSVILSKSDQMPAMPEFTDVLDMSSDEIEDMIYGVQEALGELINAFYY